VTSLDEPLKLTNLVVKSELCICKERDAFGIADVLKIAAEWVFGSGPLIQQPRKNTRHSSL